MSKLGTVFKTGRQFSGSRDEALVWVAWRFQVIFWTLVALIEARRAMRGRRLDRLQLPSVKTEPLLSEEGITQTICLIDGLVDRLLFRSKHRCFYRCYAAAAVLRRWGEPLVLNIGLRNLGPAVLTRGHCWLTLNGCKFYEHLKTEVLYPFAMGSTAGDIAYWVNFGVDNGIMRHRTDCSN